MGCDIHAMIEKKVNYFGFDLWVNAGSPEINRNYNIFSILANVRNYDNCPYISTPRGMPKDCCDEFSSWLDEWDGDAHSTSWVTLKEMKDFDMNQKCWIDLIDRLEKIGDPDSVRLVFFFDN